MDEPLPIDQRPPTDYMKYLRRKLWKVIRARVLARDGGRCFRCKGRAEEVHHRSYALDVMEGRADEFLISLCRGCHDVVEFEDAGNRRSWAEKERVLNTPDAGTDIPEPTVTIRRGRDWQFDPPPEWKRMTIVRRWIWMRRSQQLYEEERRKRRLLSETIFENRASAELAAAAILDGTALAVRFQNSGQRLQLAMFTQGHELLPNSRKLRSGFSPAAAKKRFETAINELDRRIDLPALSDADKAALVGAAIWNNRRSRRRRVPAE
jgi:hypothetical protein